MRWETIAVEKIDAAPLAKFGVHQPLVREMSADIARHATGIRSEFRLCPGLQNTRRIYAKYRNVFMNTPHKHFPFPRTGNDVLQGFFHTPLIKRATAMGFARFRQRLE